MPRRIFVAIKLSDGLQKQIVDWQNAHKDFSVRWIAPKNLHVTLIPPWHTDEIDSVKQKLRTVTGVVPFELMFTSISLGPDPKAPHLIWAQGPTPPTFQELKCKIELALGLPPQGRPLRSHITLARFNKDLPKDLASVHKQLASWQETVKEFVLMESHLQPGGSDYEILESFPLK